MQQKLKIDISTRVLDNRIRVHLVRPGARYAFRKTVAEKNVIPVDAPQLRLADGKPIPNAASIAAELERARVLRAWAKQPKANRSPRPSLGLESYRLDLEDPARASVRTRIRNAANQVLWSIPGGTVVVIPSSSLAGKAVLAEIVSRKAPREYVSGDNQNSGLIFPARKIVNAKLVQMRELPDSVIDSTRTVRVVEKISGHAEDRVLRLFYGDYQRSNDHVTGLMAGTQDFDARIIGQMIELHMAVESALETGNSTTPGTGLFDKNISKSPNFHARVDSPNGRAFLESSTVTTFVVKLMLIVASAGLPAVACATAIESGNLSVLNSLDTGTQEIVQASKDALVDFVRVSGHANAVTYIEALQDGLSRNDASVAGTAELEN